MKALMIAAAALTLCSCASDGQFRTSTSFNGQSFQSMDMTDPHFYMDGDGSPAPFGPPYAPSIPHYGIDGYCGYCQRGSGWPY
ncbi:MAG TPA: hypothetical protein VEV20_05295 [Burkholderiales bacterium]|nr:hypothetical protein [Burkholderiales bacterium]